MTLKKKKNQLRKQPWPNIRSNMGSKTVSKKIFFTTKKVVFDRRKKKKFMLRNFSYPAQQYKKWWIFSKKKFMCLFTTQQWLSWREENTERDNSFSTQYLQTLQKCAKDFKKLFYTKPFLLESLKTELKEYVKLLRSDELKQMEIRLLKKVNKGKLSKFFSEPWKKIALSPTKQQRWLKTIYNRQQKLRFKDRIDFFRTYVGQMIGSVYWRKHGWEYFKEELPTPVKQTYFNYYFCHKVSWWYENLIQKKKTPRSAKRFILDRPKTAFQIHWTQQKQEPWKDSLLFKRALYAGFNEDYRKENKFKILKIKNYLRSKNPRQEKRNRLYTRVNFLLNNFRQRYRIRADKYARIKQITSKILRPFYGHLRPHQIKRIVKKK